MLLLLGVIMIEFIKKHLVILVIGTVLAPIVIIVVGLFVIKMMSFLIVSSDPLVNIVSLTEVSSVDVLSLYISILGILIGAYLTIGVFAFQTSEEDKRIKSSMRYYRNEIINNLNLIFHKEFPDVSLELSNWIESSSEIKEHIDEADFELLNELCKKISNSKQTDNFEFTNAYMNDFYIYFRDIINDQEFDITAFLNDKTLNALNSLDTKKISFIGVKTDKTGAKFYEIIGTDKDYKYVAHQESIECDCSFNDGSPYSGFIRENKPKYYIGTIKEGKREGKGKVIKESHVLEEGEYVNGELSNGIKYGIVIHYNITDITDFNFSSFHDKFLHQLHDDIEEYDDNDDETVTKTIKIANYKVTDGEEGIIEDTIKEIKIIDRWGNVAKKCNDVMSIIQDTSPVYKLSQYYHDSDN